MATTALPVIWYIGPFTETPTDMTANAAAVQKVLHSEKEDKEYESIQPSTTYLIMFTRWPEHRGDVNDVIYDADGACEG